MKIFFLHGFLGTKNDFESFINCFKQDQKNRLSFFKDTVSFQSIDYLKEKKLQPTVKLKDWGYYFNRYIFDQNYKDEKKVLIGYSQGARLAMQAFARDPDFWHRLILISGNPGVLFTDKKVRLKSDEDWASRFLNEDFQKTVRDWNKQEVFYGSKNEPLRNENEFDREQLALCLKNWSVAWQESFKKFLMKPQYSSKIMVIVGHRDEKYKNLFSEIKNDNPKLRLAVIEDSGHRVLFDNPEKMSQEVVKFLSSDPI